MRYRYAIENNSIAQAGLGLMFNEMEKTWNDCGQRDITVRAVNALYKYLGTIWRTRA